ncbi:hypothetical protein SERLADRAFT_440804 [Serpula lacrymans var. lacrymans S7.9]|uniref:Uncharacterized protein n=1 Tax=Serpula lacrymans var. lacrymans (strain S7.9) TaxID=578457 RepID=F8P4L8_SERL9|nr:uncharacterized protein SERLADRAFT_440804 [Serpula lacrymans var. lacrymans S7.9]EGO21555.1 hypothetical protein SERLADRAFT_440804 [Serpula lacrymans var. lacrymans S7.9]
MPPYWPFEAQQGDSPQPLRLHTPPGALHPQFPATYNSSPRHNSGVRYHAGKLIGSMDKCQK